MEIKKLCKYLAITVLTAMLFFAGLYWVTRIVTPTGSIESFYDEPSQTIDVLVVGGSHAMCSIAPVEIYDKTGLTTYNLATWSQPVWISYHYIQEALKYQSPQVVILDVFGSFYDRSYLTGTDVDLVSDDFAQLIKPSFNLLGLNFSRFRSQVTRKPWSEYLNIAKYHSCITQLEWQDVEKIFHDDSTTAKGYGPFYTMEDFSSYEYPQTDRIAQLYPAAEEYLLKTIALLKERNITPILVKIPHIADENDIALVNRIHQLAQEQEVQFLDFCSTNALQLDFSVDFADHGHVNNYGAKKVTAAVAEHLAGLGLAVSHSDEVTERWQQASAFENDELQKMEIRLSKSLTEFVQRVVQHENSALIISKKDTGGLSQTDYDDLKQMLKDTSLAAMGDVLQTEQAFVLVDEQLLIGQQAVDWCDQRGIDLSADGTGQISDTDEMLSYCREGLNAVVYDQAQQQSYFYCSLAKEHGYFPYTQ